MAVLDIEKRLIAGGKTVIIDTLPPEYQQLDYQEPDQFEKNNFQNKFKRYGWTSSVAVNAEDTAPLQYQSLDQNFNFILMSDYNNQDDDSPQEATKSMLQEQILNVIYNMRKTKVDGTREVSNVIIGEIADPEFIDDNSTIVYVTTVIVKYRFRIKFN